MTVSTSISYKEYTGDGVEDEFAIPFPFLDEATYIHVYNVTNGIPSKTEYVQGVDYTITGIPANPKVDFGTPPAADVLILVRRQIPLNQLTDYIETGVFPAESHELALDKLTMLIQDYQGLLELGDTDIGTFMTIGDDGNWDGQGLEISNLTPGSDDDSATTVAQVLALISGTVPAPISGQSSWIFTANGSDTEFTISGAFGYDDEDVTVYLNGVRQYPGSSYAYVVTPSGNTTVADKVVFSTAPPAGTVILASLPTGTALVDSTNIVLGDGNVADGSLSAEKLAPGTNGQFLTTTAGVAVWEAILHTDISDFDAGVQANRLDQMAAPTASVAMGSQKITGLADGSASGDAVNYSQLSAITPFERQTGTVSWSTTSTTVRTCVVDLPFEVGIFAVEFSLTLTGTTITTVEQTVTFQWSANGTSNWRSWPLIFTGTDKYLSAAAVRTSISGGTRVTITLTLNTPGADVFAGINNKPYWAAED